MAKYQCAICNCIYDTSKGEPAEIKPGTSFEELPDSWVCPSCGICGKEMFAKVEG